MSFNNWMNNFVRKLRERLERNSAKVPDVSWTDNSGIVHTEDIVVKRSKLPLIGDWSRIYPIVKEEETGIWYKDINWINAIFGGSKNFIRTMITLAIIGAFLLGYYDVFNSYEALRQSCEPFLNINP